MVGLTVWEFAADHVTVELPAEESGIGLGVQLVVHRYEARSVCLWVLEDGQILAQIVAARA